MPSVWYPEQPVVIGRRLPYASCTPSGLYGTDAEGGSLQTWTVISTLLGGRNCLQSLPKSSM